MEPLAPILITGDDSLAERVCVELIATGSSDVRVVSLLAAERRSAFERHGVSVIARYPDADEALLEAGVALAASILTLSNDDEANLAVALRARMLNPHIRVVLRQFGTKIGRKIEQNLPDCSVISPATHAATTYAGAALDPGCFFALRFPEADGGEFVGFTRATAEQLGVGGLAVTEAEPQLAARIVAVGDECEPMPGTHLIAATDEVVAFGRVVDRTARRGHRTPTSSAVGRLAYAAHAASCDTLRRDQPDPAHALLIGSVVFYAASLLFFHFVVHSTWNGAAFDVAQMMTNSGFGDTQRHARRNAVVLVTILAMIGGTVFTSIFIGYVSSAITRAQFTLQQGLRRIRGHGHVDRVRRRTHRRRGGRSVARGRQARRRGRLAPRPASGPAWRATTPLDLLTGDATHEDVLELCDVPHAAALVVLTNSDPGNLEIALGARAIRPDVPLVVRMENRTFAQATERLVRDRDVLAGGAVRAGLRRPRARPGDDRPGARSAVPSTRSSCAARRQRRQAASGRRDSVVRLAERRADDRAQRAHARRAERRALRAAARRAAARRPEQPERRRRSLAMDESTLTLSQRADALEHQSDGAARQRPRCTRCSTPRATATRGCRPKRSSANPKFAGKHFLMGHDARLPKMPDRPTLLDFFALRMAPATHLLQSATHALRAGLQRERDPGLSAARSRRADVHPRRSRLLGRATGRAVCRRRSDAGRFARTRCCASTPTPRTATNTPSCT